MASLTNFNANEVEAAPSFDPVPAGRYIAVIVESENKPTKSNQGSYLQLTFEVIEGEHRGRRLWARLNLDNPSSMAVKIARGELAAICKAVNVIAPRDSVELHNLPLAIKVVCKKREDNGEITNEIKGYSPRAAAAGAGNGATKPPVTTTAGAAGNGGGGGGAPWKRK
jgi:hypothetical protein